MNIRDRAANALDISLNAATNKVGIRTDKVRFALAAYLDGATKLRVSTVRALCKYLEMVAR